MIPLHHCYLKCNLICFISHVLETEGPMGSMTYTHIKCPSHVSLGTCVCVLVPRLHWGVESIWWAGWIVPEQSIMWWFGSAHPVTSAALSFPSLSCTDDVALAPHTWRGLSVCLQVFDCSLLVCVCVCLWGNEACVWECVLPGERVSSEKTYGHRDCHRPSWLGLPLPLRHLQQMPRRHG